MIRGDIMPSFLNLRGNNNDSKDPRLIREGIVRDHTKIGNDVLIGTNTVIEGGCEIGNNVSIQSNVYIPRNSIIEDNVFVGPCACFTNDRYPVRVEYELKGPQLRKGCSVGGNTTFLSNIEVGEGAIVAAGAVVTRSVPVYLLITWLLVHLQRSSHCLLHLEFQT